MTADHLVLVDGHVHIYDCFDLPRLLESAFGNFAAEAERRGMQRDFAGVLLLSETANDDAFQRLLRSSRPFTANPSELSGEWHFFRTDEPFSMLASRNGTAVFLIAGRQIVTAEKLEVLALVTDRKFRDGFPVEETLRQVLVQGALPVLPWGVGKWLGRRGALVRRALHSPLAPQLSLGDISGRPAAWPRPSQFRQAEKRNIALLNGTDPLPLPAEAARVGSFGFSLRGLLPPRRPGQAILRLLDEQAPVPYGTAETLPRFLRNQIALRLRSRQGAA